MDNVVSEFTVFFEAPFWIGVFECNSAVGYEVCKITFGAEPRECEIYEFILTRWRCVNVLTSAEMKKCYKRITNPKRAQREAKKLLMRRGVGTKAQQALKKSYEFLKAERKQKNREITENKKEEKREKKRLKKKEKHRGH